MIAIRLGELAGASQQELVDTYYAALLHPSGCTAEPVRNRLLDLAYVGQRGVLREDVLPHPLERLGVRRSAWPARSWVS